MAIRHIHVRSKGGSLLPVTPVDHTIRISAGVAQYDNSSESVNFKQTVDSNGNTNALKIDSPYFDDIYSQAYDKFMNSSDSTSYANALYRINGIQPTEDGAFFINGSMCTDWEFDSNGIKITDHCVPCFTCDNVFRLKREFEYYRILLNAIKDANIYESTVVEARKSYLEGQRIEVPTSCKTMLEEISKERLIDKISLEKYGLQFTQLLRQYITTVHMWNYAVSFNNSSVQIDNTPEDSSGISIQAKRGIPSCSNDAANVECVVAVTSSSRSGMYFYIPDPTSNFTPEKFQGNKASVNVAYSVNSPNTCTITFNFGKISVPGTLSLAAKVLPFIAYRFKDGDGNTLSLAQGIGSFIKGLSASSTTSDPETGKFSESYQKLNITFELVPPNELPAKPTLSTYNMYKVYPSESSNSTITWTVTITWKITQFGQTKSYQEKYNFETVGLRKYVSGFFRASDFEGLSTE
jgi:hypothetical protein